jgi:hypothetical protein
MVEDDSGSVSRVIVLYHTENPITWHKIELPYHPESRYAEATMPSVDDPLFYFVQAVDAWGNVALALDNGRPFTRVTTLPTLHVVITGTGRGIVRSTPPGIDCGTACAAGFAPGTRVTLTAQTERGSLLLGPPFAGWDGACRGTGVCVVTMTAHTTVTATFDALTHMLHVTTTGTGSGVVTSTPPGIDCGPTCTAAFIEGTPVTLTAQADSSATFAGWGGACGGTGTCLVTMSEDRHVTAAFDADFRIYLPVVLKRKP